MGLFGKLFEKKICDICGEEIDLLGNRKLENGNCCKVCASRLSPWFSGRKHATVEEIRAQLDYRDKNRALVDRFHVTRALGGRMKVLLDEDDGTFLVTPARDLAAANPDVLRLDQVTGCELEVRETPCEIRQEGTEGEEGCRPCRCTYRCSFSVAIRVNHPYFDVIRFDLSDADVTVEASGGEGSTAPPTLEECRSNAAYARCEQMGLEIKEALTAAPKKAVTCPRCGAAAPPDPNGCCQYCGSRLCE